MPLDDPTETFDEISAMDSAALFKPQVPALVVTDAPERGPNLMAAAWWMVAGYSPFRFQLAVSHKTYTYELIEETGEFVMAAPTRDMTDAIAIAGTVSGRELDKIDHLGLETVPGQSVDVPLLVDAVGNIEFSVMDSFEFENCTYYFGSVEHAYVEPDGLDDRILSLETDVLANMGSDWASDDDAAKHRYHVAMDPEDLEAYPEEEALKTLPPDLREKYLD